MKIFTAEFLAESDTHGALITVQGFILDTVYPDRRRKDRAVA